MAVTDSGKRWWYVGRGTYAAVIIFPKATGEVSERFTRTRPPPGSSVEVLPAKYRPCSALTAAMAAGIDGHFTYTFPWKQAREDDTNTLQLSISYYLLVSCQRQALGSNTSCTSEFLST